MILDIFRDPGLGLTAKLLMLGMWLLAMAIALTVHEYAHARSAMAFGDNTAREAGRTTLNPLAHYDLIGSTLILWMGFGWAKPVPVNPGRMRHPRLHAMLVSLWGPFSNLLLAALFVLPLRFLPDLPGLVQYFLLITVVLNLSLALFNLLPVPPLDGSHIVSYMLPERAALAWERFIAQFGFLLLIGILWFGGPYMGRFVSTAVDRLLTLLLGG